MCRCPDDDVCIPPKYATNPPDTTIHCYKVCSELWCTKKNHILSYHPKSHIIIIPSKITHHHAVQNHTSSSHTKSHFIISSTITPSPYPPKITHYHPVQNHTSSSHPKSHFIIPYKIALHHLIQNHTIIIPSKNHTSSSSHLKSHIIILYKITLHHPIQNHTSSSYPPKSHIIIPFKGRGSGVCTSITTFTRYPWIGQL